VPYIRWVEDDQAQGPLAETYEAWKEQNPGRPKIPDILKCLSLRPDFLRAVIGFIYPLHFADGHLTRRQKEMIATLVSGLNRCPY
jgi:hypothetical protein